MTDPTQLSPAAQAIKDAVLATYADNIPKDNNLWALERASTVAALRAAADRVVPEQPHEDTFEYCCDYSQARVKDTIRAKLLAIADELEDAQ